MAACMGGWLAACMGGQRAWCISQGCMEPFPQSIEDRPDGIMPHPANPFLPLQAHLCWLPSVDLVVPCTDIHQVGHIDKVIMGLDKNNNTPCGFCFVIYYTREESERCVKYINGTVLDDRIVRVDHDWGFQEGRQWGRGRSGGQVGAAGRNTGPCKPRGSHLRCCKLRIWGG